MPKISRKPTPDQAQPLIAVIKKGLEEKQVSLRTAAKEMGISPAHLSLILNREEVPDAGVCNAIADFLGIPRVQVYGLTGWLDLGEQDDEALTDSLSSFVDTPEQVNDLKWVYYSIGDKNARKDFLKWIERNHSRSAVKTQRPSDLNE